MTTRASTTLNAVGKSRKILNIQPGIPSKLTLLILGADHNEGFGISETFLAFGGLTQALAQRGCMYLRMYLVGPHIPTHVCNKVQSDVYVHGVHVSVQYYQGSYHDLVAPKEQKSSEESSAERSIEHCSEEHSSEEHSAEQSSQEHSSKENSEKDLCSLRPDLVLCFNAGVWGYESWIPTLSHIFNTVPIHKQGIVLLVTSYSVEEGEDDYDAIISIIEDLVEKSQSEVERSQSAEASSVNNVRKNSLIEECGSTCTPACKEHDNTLKSNTLVKYLWEPEVNPYRCMEERGGDRRQPGVQQHENFCWQCIHISARIKHT